MQQPLIPKPSHRRFARPRRGAVSWVPLVMIASLVVLALLFMQMGGSQSPRSGRGLPSAGESTEPLVVYVAASNKSVFEKIRADYETEFSTQVVVQYGPSQSLLASAEVSESGDLYLPADDSFLDIARERKLINKVFPLADMQAVVAVPQGNPQNIQTLADLLKPGVRVSQANPDAAAIAKLTKQVLSASGQWDALAEQTTVFKTTVHEVANDVKVGAVDAGIVYDAVLHDYADLEAVPIPELAPLKSRIALARLNSSQQPKRALHFARYVASKDKGLQRYAEYGFTPVDGDAWQEEPELILYAGSMLRPAIEETITKFEQEEGVRVTRVYNGCGILVAQMKAGQIPDAYFACDTEFMGQVSEFFPQSESVSQNELVILVQKGNPFNITSLKDLTKPGIRLGIGHEKQCAMGWITQQTFTESGLQTELMENVVVQTPTGDMLVNQMRSGSLDAAVAYLSNAAGSAAFLDAIRIHGIPCSVATQPYGTAKSSQNKLLSNRLLETIRSENSREKFSSEGFEWLADRSKRDE